LKNKNQYEVITEETIESIKELASAGKEIELVKIWKKSYDKYQESKKRLNNIRTYKSCPKQTFLWIIKYIFEGEINDYKVISKSDIENKNGLYAGIVINELLNKKIEITDKSSKIWEHIKDVNQTKVNVVKTHNAQIDVVKGLWNEISKIDSSELKKRLKKVGIQNV
jgi:hypothetical protein